MKEKQITSNSTDNDSTPDELMEGFRGKSLKSIVVFTIIVHAVILLGTSVPFILEKVGGKDTSKVSKEERIELALKKAKDSLSDIAEEHGLSVNDISGQFAGSAKPKSAAKKPVKETTTPTTEPEKPKSTIEKELEVKANGPELPKVEDDDENLFR